MPSRSLARLLLRASRAPAWAAIRERWLSRRLFLAALSRLPLGAAILFSGGRAFADWPPQRIDAHAERTIAAVVDRMLPTDALPGGLALGIDRRILETNDPELRRSLMKAVAWLDGRARREGAAAFLRLADAQQEAVLQAALDSGAEGAHAIVFTLRNLAFRL